MKRRELLKGGLVAATAALAGCFPSGLRGRAAPAALAARPWSGRVRNLIFFAYDGTGYQDLTAAGHFSRRVLKRPLVFERLLARGLSASMHTYSLTSLVTDSSAASTAWATGRKVVNPAMSMLPDGTKLTTIMQLAQDRGKRLGLVTTARCTHATPAAWLANVPHRDLEEEIALQYLDRKPDVVLGGARGPFEAASREDGRDLFAEFRRAGYDVVTTTEEFERSTASRLLGAFTPALEYLPYEVDRRFQSAPVPPLSALTRKALDVLEGSSSGYLLQVEAGRPDHANHYNDPGALVWEWMAADETLDLLMRHVDGRDDTLLIVASDHDTGGGVVYGYGPWFLRSTEAFETLAEVRASHEWLVAYGMPRQPAPVDVQEAVRRYLGVPIGPEQSAQLSAALATRPTPRELRLGHRNAHQIHPNNTVGYVMSVSPEGLADRPNMAFSTSQHTTGLVPAVLYGPMVAPGALGVIDNTELFDVMIDALGIEHSNPSMSEERAREITGTPTGPWTG